VENLAQKGEVGAQRRLRMRLAPVFGASHQHSDARRWKIAPLPSRVRGQKQRQGTFALFPGSAKYQLTFMALPKGQRD